MKKSSRFDALLGQLSVEEKIAQMLVFGVGGTMIDPLLVRFVKQYGLGGFRVTPNGDRKAVRYLPEGARGVEHVNRVPQWQEKFIDCKVPAPFLTPGVYSGQLNDFRRLAFDRRGLGLPMHVVADCEAAGGNFAPPYMISMPQAMGFGDLGDLDLLERSWRAMARQLKAVGIDWLHSPVVDVNTNPRNPEISARSFSADPAVVTACAAANLRGMKAGNVINCLKHYPGRGDSAEDAHFGLPVINASREALMSIHLRPYRELIAAGGVESVMLAHTVFPRLDPAAEVATVSEYLIRELLRGELGFEGVITTDSLTMGGLMARYSVSEAAIRAINYGVDLLLLKDENALRFELHRDLVEAVRQGRIAEATVDRSLCRVWSLKYDHGLFEQGGAVDSAAADDFIRRDEFRRIGVEMSEKVRNVVRLEPGILPLKPEQKVLIIDRITGHQLRRNDYWNYPGMFFEFMRRFSDNLGFCDYDGRSIDRALAAARQLFDDYDLIVLTSDFDRSEAADADRTLAAELAGLGKPVIQIASNPYPELLIPETVRNVIVTYGLMHEQLEAVSRFLYGR